MCLCYRLYMNTVGSFSDALAARLEHEYGSTTFGQLNSWQTAPLLQDANENIHFATIGGSPNGLAQERADSLAAGDDPTQTERKRILYIGGHLGGIVAGAPFAAELAKLGYEVTVPDQHRGSVQKERQLPSPMYTRALDIASVIEASGLAETGVDAIVVHSEAALCLNALGRIAERRGWNILDNTSIVMLAPAGVIHGDHPLALKRRFEGRQKPITAEGSWWPLFEDLTAPGAEFQRANPLRATLEELMLGIQRVNFKGLLARGVKKIGVFPYEHDNIFPPKLFASAVRQNRRPEVTFRTITSEAGAGEVSHSDQQIHPRRIAEEVDAYLKESDVTAGK